jgi:hypothetical protein
MKSTEDKSQPPFERAKHSRGLRKKTNERKKDEDARKKDSEERAPRGVRIERMPGGRLWTGSATRGLAARLLLRKESGVGREVLP